SIRPCTLGAGFLHYRSRQWPGSDPQRRFGERPRKHQALRRRSLPPARGADQAHRRGLRETLEGPLASLHGCALPHNEKARGSLAGRELEAVSMTPLPRRERARVEAAGFPPRKPCKTGCETAFRHGEQL